MKKTPWQERFWEHVIRIDVGCWEWRGIIMDGYGYLNVNRQIRRAHRLSWTLHFGIIPDHLCVLHRCDNRKCVNPEHLFLGTPADNAADMIRKGRSMNGGRNNKAKLTPEQVRTIRELYAVGNFLQREIAEQFGVNQQSVSHVVRGKTWQEDSSR